MRDQSADIEVVPLAVLRARIKTCRPPRIRRCLRWTELIFTVQPEYLIDEQPAAAPILAADQQKAGVVSRCNRAMPQERCEVHDAVEIAPYVGDSRVPGARQRNLDD